MLLLPENRGAAIASASPRDSTRRPFGQTLAAGEQRARLADAAAGGDRPVLDNVVAHRRVCQRRCC